MENFAHYKDKHMNMIIGEPPQPKFVYYAYGKGNVHECASAEEARAISKNYERVDLNADAIKEYRARRIKAEQDAAKEWYDDLRKEYNYLSDEAFSLCYNYAYDESHSYGYDEVANKLIEVEHFFSQAIKVIKNEKI